MRPRIQYVRGMASMLRVKFKNADQETLTSFYGCGRNDDTLGYFNLFKLYIRETQHYMFAYGMKEYCKWGLNAVEWFIKNVRSNWYYIDTEDLNKVITINNIKKKVSEWIEESPEVGKALLTKIRSFGVNVKPYLNADWSAETLIDYVDMCTGNTATTIPRDPYNNENVRKHKLRRCLTIKHKRFSKIKKYIETTWRSNIEPGKNVILLKDEIALMDPTPGYCGLRYAFGPQLIEDLPEKTDKNGFFINTLHYDLIKYFTVTFAKLKPVGWE